MTEGFVLALIAVSFLIHAAALTELIRLRMRQAQLMKLAMDLHELSVAQEDLCRERHGAGRQA